jgi:hypothetical protein
LNANLGFVQKIKLAKRKRVELALAGTEWLMLVAVEFIFVNVVRSKEGAGNHDARGHYTVDKEMTHLTIDCIRKTVDQCTGVQDFLIFPSFGGTVTGFGSLPPGLLSVIVAIRASSNSQSIERLTCTNLNQLIGQVVSSPIESLRFGGARRRLHRVPDEFVPGARIPFQICS